MLAAQRVLSRARMLEFLGELDASPGDEYRSLYLPPRPPLTKVEGYLKEMHIEPVILPELADLASHSGTGSAVLQSPAQTCLVLPPFPVAGKRMVNGLSTEPLQALLRRDYMLALVLVRLGAYAIGVCRGENLISSKVGTGLIHGRHRKGGSSQQRFARHRDKQIEYFLTRVCQHAREQLRSPALDYIIYGGARTTIHLLQKQCPFLEQLDTPKLPLLLDIPDPRQAVLVKAVIRAWSSTVVVWRED
jgi:hypothetical protein